MNLSLLLLLHTLLLLAIMAMRWVSDRSDQPSVLGELLLGVAIGNIGVWLGYSFFEIVMNADSADVAVGSASAEHHAATDFQALAEIGAILLLFSAGLESIFVLPMFGVSEGVTLTVFIMRWEMPWWETILGVIEIFVLGWLFGALIACCYNWLGKRNVSSEA